MTHQVLEGWNVTGPSLLACAPQVITQGDAGNAGRAPTAGVKS